MVVAGGESAGFAGEWMGLTGVTRPMSEGIWFAIGVLLIGCSRSTTSGQWHPIKLVLSKRVFCGSMSGAFVDHAARNSAPHFAHPPSQNYLMALTRTDISIILLALFAVGVWQIAPHFPGKEEQEHIKEANRPLRCTNAEQCFKYWARATQWVRSNTSYRVMNETADVIETYNPLDTSKSNKLSYKAYKKAGDHATVIDIEVECNRWFDGCSPSPVAARAAFKRYVRDTLN